MPSWYFFSRIHETTDLLFLYPMPALLLRFTIPPLSRSTGDFSSALRRGVGANEELSRSAWRGRCSVGAEADCRYSWWLCTYVSSML